MKIVHLCLSNFYIDNYAYQENELVAQNVEDGHDVVVIASTETFGADRRLSYLKPGSYLGSDGARIIRLPYRKWLPHAVMRKLRAHPDVYKLLERENPDVMLFHGLCGWELNAAAKYKKAHPEVKLYVDSHEDFNNSARSFISRHLLHFAYYRLIVKRCLNVIDKILCISIETMNFVSGFYGVPLSKLEFFPLGGKILNDTEYACVRAITRQQYGIKNNEILFVQSGKMDASKKVLHSLRAFSNIVNPDLRFVLAGHLQGDIAAEALELIKRDYRIEFVGWKTPDDLRRLLCAADVYVQPGTQSATMQMSVCCRCAVILDDVPSHHPFIDGNGWLLNSRFTLDQAFRVAADSAEMLSRMAKKSEAVAARLLDYRALAGRLYH